MLSFIPVQQDSVPVSLAADTVSIWLPDSLLSLRASQGNLCKEEAGGFLSPLFLKKNSWYLRSLTFVVTVLDM